MSLSRWDICLASVKFEDTEEEKTRPVLILKEPEACAVLIECLKMTSQPPRFMEYSLQDWMGAGLQKATVVRISKQLTLHVTKIYKKIGRLQPIDIVGVERAILAQSK